MKKIFSGIFVLILLVCCGLFSGCGDKYANLSFSVGFVSSGDGYSSEYIPDEGVNRVKTPDGTYDDNLDGSYTFYISQDTSSTATFEVVFAGVPGDFNYGVSFSLSNEILKIDNATVYSGNSVKKTITAFEKGSTVLTAFSNETGKSSSVTIHVVKIAKQMLFTNNNLAIANNVGSKINLDNNEVVSLYPTNSSITKIDYQLGYYKENPEGGETFTAYTSQELAYNGIIFNKAKKTIEASGDGIKLESFYLKATYLNPLGENLEAETKVKVVKPLGEIEIYMGETKDDATPDNLLDENDIKNLIINIEDMNYVNLIIRSRSNGENVKLGILTDSSLPVIFKDNRTEYSYYEEDKQTPSKYDPVTGSNWARAVWTDYYVKIIATKKTTENDIYPSGIYGLKFTANYADYIVEGYPVINTLNIRNDTLVKNFSVNGEVLENVSIVDYPETNAYYDGEVYINADEASVGTELRIDIANPVTILKENAKFNVKFYDEDLKQITNASEYFKAQRRVGSSSDLFNVTDNFVSLFDKNTTFYLKPNAAKVALGQVYYMVITAELPSEEEFESKRANATIKLTIAQGVKEFINYDYNYKKYEIDKDTGLYKQTIEEVNKTGIAFDQTNYTGLETINIDLTSGFDSFVTLYYEPAAASLKNVSIVSSDEKIIKVNYDKKGEDLNKFSITGISLGKASVIISTTSLEVEYKINVNVYRPITGFRVNLSSTNTSYGVGGYTLDAEKQNVKTAEVKVNKLIALDFSILPSTANQYSLIYSVYKTEILEENLIGTYSIDHNGVASSEITTIGNEEFQFNCKTNSFIFVNDQAAKKVYYVVIKLVNLDDSYWSRDIQLKSYVPVETIDVDISKTIVYNPQAIAYETKTNDENDPTVFALKIDVNKPKNNGETRRVPTYNFNDYGKLVVLVNGVTENIFTVQNGSLVGSNSNSVLKLISPTVDSDGYYWFELNENYDYSKITSAIFLSVQIREINSDAINNVAFRVFEAERLSFLRTNSEDQLYFKQGLSEDKQIEISVGEETAYNKNLIVKVYDILTFNEVDYYVEDELYSYLKDVRIDTTETTTKFSLNVSPSSAGKSVLIVMPQDRVVTESDYKKWTQKSFVEIAVTQEEFVEGRYFNYIGTNYVPAVEYVAGEKYFIETTSLDDVISLWEDFLTFYVTVADGIKVPYHVSSIDDLYAIGENSDSVTKRYVITKDIILDSTVNWQPLAKYYPVYDIVEENFSQGVYYTFNEGEYIKQSSFAAETQYFAYGFNGELSGKFSYRNIITKKEINYYYKISNLAFVGTLNNAKNGYGLFAEVGKNGRIVDLSVSYDFFQPVVIENLVFGGIAAYNYGTIESSEVKFNNFTLYTDYPLTFGGVVGINDGYVTNERTSSLGITGLVTIGISNNGIAVNIGGIVGVNNNTVSGSYDITKEIVYTFNNAGFDTSLNIVVENLFNPTKKFDKTAIGGAVGINNGSVKNLSVQGRITAPDCNNVGGIIGKLNYSEKFNGEKTIEGTEDKYMAYAVESSYSIAKVTGYVFVGGAIGYASSSNDNIYIYIYNISAENYVSGLSSDRTFVKGYENVGGLIGLANHIKITYSYVVSYYDCSEVKAETDGTYKVNNYDVQGNKEVAGFISEVNNSYIGYSAAFVNVHAISETAIFICSANEYVTANDIFARGSIYSTGAKVSTLGVDPAGEWYYEFYSNSATAAFGNSFGATDQGDLKTCDVSGIDGWARNDNINDGYPYLTIQVGAEEQVLFATTPIVILSNVKDNQTELTEYIKNDASSLILFFNYDYLNKYPVSEILKLNLVKFNEFSDLEVYAKTHKTARLNISTSNSKVISISEDGTLKIVGEGSVTITVASKLNTNYKIEIYIVVKYGVNDINLYSNIALNDNLKDGDTTITILKSMDHTLYMETLYNRVLENGKNAELKSTNNIATRFIVETKDDDSLKNILDAADGTFDGTAIYTINDLFKINDLTWLYDDKEERFVVDIPANTNPIIKPVKAMESLPDGVAGCDGLTIKYEPIIKETFNTTQSTIILDLFEGDFKLSIIKGATDILFENNIELPVKISQLETLSFTVTLYTDYEQDEIVDNFNLENSDEKLVIVKSDITRRYKDGSKTELVSISITYTINYKDKMNAVENDLYYNFHFSASSDVTKCLDMPFVILGQDKISQVYGTIYANLTDFPQEPEKNKIIYNANVGVLSVEVYPFFSNYNKMRVYYKTVSQYPLLMTQLSYNISGETGNKLTVYDDSGSITDFNDVMIVQKSSGQDTYLLNNLGTYSYSKIYFFSLLTGSEVPDNTTFSVYVEFLNRDNTIIETFVYDFQTIAQPSVTFSFDEELKSENDIYYLPLNTVNEVDVKLVNYEGDIAWTVATDDDYELSQNEIDILTPVKNANGVYTMRVLKYTNSGAHDNLANIGIIGKKIKITAFITDGQKQYHHSETILITMFSVKDINIQNTTNGYMTVPMSTTTPLQVTLDLWYDEALLKSEDNWYTNWYTQEYRGEDTTNTLYQYLTACGYEVTEHFSGYISQLTNAISKANYNYKDTSSTKTSGVWFYNDGDNSGYLQTNKDYNNTTFGVELYNEFFAIYGYQIDINSNLAMKVNLSYTNNEGELVKEVNANGIPNVYNYNISASNTTYETAFKIEKEFVLTFVYKSDLINAIPVSTAEEFMSMREGFDYRLIKDIVLTDYVPIETAVNTFDGNNYNIYITNFAESVWQDEDGVLGLFSTVNEKTILYNVSVYYTNTVTVVSDVLTPGLAGLSVSLPNAKTVLFGGIAATNNGTLTNCKVSGRVNLTLNIDINSGTIAEALNGSMVAVNNSKGYITNSKVENFDFNCYGVTGGFVGENKGKVVSSYFNNSSINNLSSEDTAGFVYDNSGYIYECYTQGYRKESDNDIRNTGSGVASKGIVGGFVHTNSNIISDCYSNISLSSSRYIAGFIYKDVETSVISRCYSISSKASADNSTVASPFAAANSASYTKITINGTLNNCYYLNIAGTWSDLTWESASEDKQAKGLTLDQFATHTNFVNYDLSLIYNKSSYADGTTFNYVDGYTWVIIEGKPVIVSTLVKTISQRDYVGKSKNYSDASFNYYNASKITRMEKIHVLVGQDKERVSYYDNSEGLAVDNLTDKQLVFYTMQDNTKNTLTYTFVPKGDNEVLTIVYSIELQDGVIKSKTVTSAEYGEGDNVQILDVKDSVGSKFVEDKNFRANDTIEIYYDEDGIINNIEYKDLESASYYYGSNAFKISHVVGSRTNPQMIYDYESFVYYTSNDNIGKHYKIVKDLDFDYQFTPTAYITFKGAIQGNYMDINNLSISYLNSSSAEALENSTNAFGLFAKIATAEIIISESGNLVDDKFNTTISNLNLNIVEVLSNSHNYVGALAGELVAENSRKIMINNIKVSGVDGLPAYVQGKNAVGGLAGIATGEVIIKDISVAVNVNATKEVNIGDAKKLLYTNKNLSNISSLAYAGGVIGIFESSKVNDPSTQKDYNANNISISGDISIIGGIVGSAFGMIGRNTVVNYVNTVVNSSERNYLKATAYAGGLVGENRGKIQSSSITYGKLESYSSVQVGVSNLTAHEYFFNGRKTDTVIAIGGLVGINNGGYLTNSLANINVRNKNATIAGGAVGRMIQGKLSFVTTTGSVLAGEIIGGFIGTLNNYDIIVDEDNANTYDSSAIVGNLQPTSNASIRTVISNCVSGTNWLVEDYKYYANLINNENPVAAFIGLVSYKNVIAGYDVYDFASFFENGIDNGYNYFTNTLYSSSASTIPQMYLKPAYKSQAIDKLTTMLNSTIEVFTHQEGSGASAVEYQVTFPYSMREIYYEDTVIGPNYVIDTVVNSTHDPNSYPDSARNIYTLKSSTSDIENINDLYVNIEIPAGYTPPEDGFNFEWYTKYYGKIYAKVMESGAIKEIVPVKEGNFAQYEADPNAKFCYIKDPALKSYKVTQKYLTTETHDIVLLFKDNAEPTKVSKYTYTNIQENVNVSDQLINVQSIIINGIQFANINGANLEREIDLEGNRTYTNSKINIVLPNGTIANKIVYYFKKIVKITTTADGDPIETIYYNLEYVQLSYRYDVEDASGNPSQYISNKIESSRASQTYRLSVKSKQVVYENYLDNGYWKVGTNFLLDGDYEKVDKHLINKEYAEVYIWSSFTNDVTLTEENGSILIYSAEELALFAKLVNSSATNAAYASKKVIIERDIDLSGKYWVPIGTSSYPFKGTFTGLYNDKVSSIKYATVNSNSINNSSSAVSYAGLFGVVQNATISDLIITGGDMNGNYSGGVVAYAKGNTTIKNVTNRNNVVGNIMAGGIVGWSDATGTEKLLVENAVNYGEISHHNTSPITSKLIAFGGVVGRAQNIESKNNVNNGLVYVFNNKTSYSGSDSKEIEICVGGIIGKAASFIAGVNNNYGSISINSNAHTIKLGGIIGCSSANGKTIKDQKNYGNLDVYSNNIYSVEGENKRYSMILIGGIVGNLRNNLTLCGNEGKINFILNTTANAYVGVGGIAGLSAADVKDASNVIGISESYNTNNIEVSSINKKTHISLGGITGYIDVASKDTNVVHCYNSGDLQSNSNGTIFAGGIAGSAVLAEETSDSGKITKREFTYSKEEYEGKTVTIGNCINIGYVNIANIDQQYNSLGAIIGLGVYGTEVEEGELELTQMFVKFNETTNKNYYLRDSAYSGSKIYPAYGAIVVTEISAGLYETTYRSINPENEVGCSSQLAISLKDKSVYDAGWTFGGSGKWVQAYDTWFPSIKNNLSSSMWIDKQENVSQEKGSYVVSSAEELAYLSAQINSGEIESTNITVKLTDYIDLANRYWTPIGTEDNPFRGTFDGNGYVIRNLTVDGSVMEDDEYGALFGFIENATIKNVGLESVIIKNVNYAASIAYSAVNSSLNKVYSDSGSSSDTSVSGTKSAGGLVCFANNCFPSEENNFKAGVYYSYNNVPVKLVGSYGEGVTFVGGLVAKLTKSLIDSSYNNVKANISTTQSLDNPANDSIVITGQADNDSSLFNVFNLAWKVTVINVDGGVETPVSSGDCYPCLYDLTPGTDFALIEPSLTPVVENFTVKEGLNNKDIWTVEYTLNDAAKDGKFYPSIRGLGQEWKNTESESLINVPYNELNVKANEIITRYGLNTLVNPYKDNSIATNNKTYYFVTSAEELAWISTNVNTGNLATINSEFILLNDIDLSDRYWTPIGSNSVYPFQGIFNFNGHVIKGLRIDSSSLSYGGLFGYTNGAKILNGYLIDCFVKVTSKDEKTNLYVGSLVGKGYNTTIENISVTTAVAAFSNAGSFVGGLIGSLTGTQDYKISNVRVEKSLVNGPDNPAYIDVSSYEYQAIEIREGTNIEITEKTANIGAFSDGGNVYAGGIVGYISGYEMEEIETEFLVNAAYNGCNITAVSMSEASRVFAGGVVGYALEEVALNNIQNSAIVKTFTNQNFDFIGGVVGYMNNGSIQNAYFTGYVECCQDFNNHIISYVGGIVAYIVTEGWVKNSVNNGRINDNPAYKTLKSAVIGGVIGFSGDRNFKLDSQCIYAGLGGFNEYSGVGVYEPADVATQEDLNKIFTTDLTAITEANGFDKVLWKSQALRSKMIYVCGTGTSFNSSNVDEVTGTTQLSSQGKLAVDMSSFMIKYGSQGYEEGDKIGISLVTKDYEYVYVTTDMPAGTNADSEINLFNLIKAAYGKAPSDNVITYCITLIRKTVTPGS